MWKQNGGKGQKLGEQSVLVQTISNPQVAGSNPAGRAKINAQSRELHVAGGFGFEPATGSSLTRRKKAETRRSTVVLTKVDFARAASANPAGRAKINAQLYKQVLREYQARTGLRPNRRRIRELALIEFLWAKRWYVGDTLIPLKPHAVRRNVGLVLMYFWHVPEFMKPIVRLMINIRERIMR